MNPAAGLSHECLLEEARIIRSGRKSISVSISDKAEILVHAPYAMTEGEIHAFMQKHLAWIEKHLGAARRRLEKLREEAPIPREEIRALADKALLYIPPRVRQYADRLGISYGRITIRNQTSRWGSCSAKGNLNFNCLLMLAPPDVIDYVIVHELCHRIELNHSPRFWKLVADVLPDYPKQKKWLKEEGTLLIARMRMPSR